MAQELFQFGGFKMRVLADGQFKKMLMEELKSERRNTSNTATGITQRGYGKPQKRAKKTQYEIFLDKCEDFDKYAPKFNSVDLVFYFRKVAEAHGYKFYIANMGKEAKLMKKLKEQYDSLEICAMIEFLYESEQNYLEKERLCVGILCSGWATTIHSDTMLWVNDEYKPRTNKKTTSTNRKTSLKGEWDYNDKKKTKIGEWE